MEHQNLRNGIDYYVDDDGRFVFTKEYHLARGHCCMNGCRHFPFGYQNPPRLDADERTSGAVNK